MPQPTHITVTLSFKVLDPELLEKKALEGFYDCNGETCEFDDVADAASIACLCSDLVAPCRDYGLELIDAEGKVEED